LALFDAIRRTIPRRARALLRGVRALADSGPYFSHPERVDGVAQASIHATARLTILDAETSAARIMLGDGVYLGRAVELTAAGGGSVVIDEDTSLQDGSIVAGHVQIGAHCLFGRYNFIASRGHNFRYRPTWLIRDQDDAVMDLPLSPALLNESKVRIEEDCWFGQSVVASPGIYVGRGAVIGSNAVVTSDIGPYEVHAGVPNKKIGTRLVFTPPHAISAGNDEDIPYFYRGFRLSRDALSKSRQNGVIFARSQCAVVLASAAAGLLTLSGSCIGEAVLGLKVNGRACGEFKLAPGAFNISAIFSSVSSEASPPMYSVMDKYTLIDITVLSPGGTATLGLSTVKIEAPESKIAD